MTVADAHTDHTSTRPWSRLLSVNDAARYAGVSVNTFRSWCTVTPLRRGKRVLYDKLDIDAWIDGEKQKQFGVGQGDWTKRFDDCQG